MEKKLVLLTAAFALTAGFVFAQETKGTEPAAADTAVTMPADEGAVSEDVISNEVLGNEVMGNETMADDMNAADEAPMDEPAAEGVQPAETK